MVSTVNTVVTQVSTTYVTDIMDSLHMVALTALKETVVNCLVFLYNIFQLALRTTQLTISSITNNCHMLHTERHYIWVMRYGTQRLLNIISVISWRSDLLVDETGDNHRPLAGH